jgi:hypothetical protein
MSTRILTSVYIKVSLFPHFRIRFQTQHPIPLVTGEKSQIDVVSPLSSPHLMFCMQKQISLPRISGNNTDQLGLPRHALETSGWEFWCVFYGCGLTSWSDNKVMPLQW